jgi:hypothetical protein
MAVGEPGALPFLRGRPSLPVGGEVDSNRAALRGIRVVRVTPAGRLATFPLWWAASPVRCMARSGKSAAGSWIISSARSVREGVSLPRRSRAATGSATGFVRKGWRTTTARMIQVLPYPGLSLPRPEPSCAHRAPKTFFPTRCGRVPSMTARIGASTGSRASTTEQRARRGPSRPGSHDAALKKACAQRCGHSRDSPAPVSIPVTVRRPAWAVMPTTMWQNVSYACFVKHGRVTCGTSGNDAGSVIPGTISGRSPSRFRTKTADGSSCPALLHACQARTHPDGKPQPRSRSRLSTHSSPRYLRVKPE